MMTKQIRPASIRARVIPYAGVRCEFIVTKGRQRCGRAASVLLEREGTVLGQYCKTHLQKARDRERARAFVSAHLGDEFQDSSKVIAPVTEGEK